MVLKEMYVVMVREKGLFLVAPVPGEDQRTTIETALGLKSGYSSGMVELDMPEGAAEFWISWVEEEAPNGAPTFEYRVLDGAMTQEQAEQKLGETAVEILKLNRSEIYTRDNPKILASDEAETERPFNSFD